MIICHFSQFFWLKSFRNILIVFFFIFLNFIFLGSRSALFAKELRPLTSERPSKSDSAYTLNKFRGQIEQSFFSKTFDKSDNSKTILSSYFDYLTIRFGISDHTEIQYIYNGYSFVKKTQNNIVNKDIDGGSGEKFIRIKRNILGNDSGKIGLAVTPFLKIDDAQNVYLRNDLKGGIVAPFHYNISNDLTFGGMFQVNYYKAISNNKNINYLGFINSYYISKTFNNKYSSYLEFYSLKTFNYKKHLKNYIDFGVNYLVSDNVKLDLGINIGASRRADDLNYFSGLTWRF